MKPLSEFAEELVKSRGFFEVAYRYRHAPETDQVEVVRRFEELKAHIKGELQAWLGEADEDIDSAMKRPWAFDSVGAVLRWFRRRHLGTTQEGK